MKMMVGSTWNAKMLAYCAPSAPSAAFMTRPHTVPSPSGPNTNDAPTPAKPSSRVIASPSTAKTRCPPDVLSTRIAKTICRESPHATVVQLMARRRVEKAYAMPRMTKAPKTGWRKPSMSTHLGANDRLTGGRLVAHGHGSPQERHRGVEARALTIVQFEERIAGAHGVPWLGENHDAHGRIDGVLDAIAAGAERNRRAADEHRIEPGDDT